MKQTKWKAVLNWWGVASVEDRRALAVQCNYPGYESFNGSSLNQFEIDAFASALDKRGGIDAEPR